MPTRNISLTTAQDGFIDRMVRNGTYQNASEAVRDGLRLLKQRRQEDAAKLRALPAVVQAGLDDLARGDYVEVDSENLESFLAALPDDPAEAAD